MRAEGISNHQLILVVDSVESFSYHMFSQGSGCIKGAKLLGFQLFAEEIDE